MAKRKRNDSENLNSDETSSPSSQLEATLLEFERQLARALAVVKSFERQRQAKRLQARTTPADKKQRIEREAQVLSLANEDEKAQSLDLSQVARAQLTAVILRSIAGGAGTKNPSSSSSSSSPTTAVPRTADLLPPRWRHPVGLPDHLPEVERAALHNVTSNLANQARVRAVLDEARHVVSTAIEAEAKAIAKAQVKAKAKPVNMAATLQHESEHEDDDEGGVPLSAGLSNHVQDLLSDNSNSDSDSDSSDNAVDRINVVSTHHLPTLMGGYVSGSDSEASVIDVAPPMRKNRRGQRARQQLAERKYKDKARHLLKQQQKREKSANDDRNGGWDMKRGAVADGEDRRGSGRAPMKGRQPFEAMGNAEQSHGSDKMCVLENGATAPMKATENAIEAKLHPSWEAKRLAKARESQASFQGKKIVFD